ncbi:MAG: iron-containing alcohol dehydrogenase [Muribaculaceae bacterium]|nr:iron-containing alcohol dehydrogenase [Muribaculaceae bacterium]
MENFTFFPATKYVFGRGVENQVADQLKVFGMKKPLIVYGKGSVVRSGLLDRVRKSIADAGIEHEELGGVQPNPTDDKVYEGIALAKEKGVDSLLAVGGGSSIDTAKAIAAALPYNGDFWDFYCGKAKVTKALPVGVVLTIPAAGSEGSGNTVITKISDMRKLGMGSDSLRPKFALMNPELTFTLPPYQTAAGITDMLAHIMERYFSNTPEVEITDRVAEGVMKAIITEAPKVMADPENYDARANIMWSGTLAHNGVCSGGRVEDWATHALEHELSALYGVTHGAGLAVMFPAWMTYAMRENPGKLAQYARRVFDVEEADDTKAAAIGIERLKDFLTSIGMPVTMKGLVIENADTALLAQKVTESKGDTFGNYIRIDRDTARRIYDLAK